MGVIYICSTILKQRAMSMMQYKVFLLCVCYLQTGSSKKICPAALSNECQCDFNKSATQPAVSCDFSSQSKPLSLWRQGSNEYKTSLYSLRISTLNEKRLPDNFFNDTRSVNFLNLSYNSMTMFPYAVLRIMKIKNLDMSHNAFSNMDAKPNEQLVVESLNLSSNAITFMPRLFFKMFKNLQRLDLSRNSLNILPDQIFVYLKWVRHLDLSYNSLQHISRAHFGNAGKNLQAINLRGNQLKQIEPDFFKNFANLKSIDLSYNDQIINMATVSFPTHLSHLDVTMCRLNDLNFCNLLQLPDLLSLIMDGNSIPCGCELESLRESMARNKEFSIHSDITPSPLKCQNNTGNEVNISDKYSVCNEQQKNNFASKCVINQNKELRMDVTRCQGEITLQSRISSDTVMAEWEVGSSCTQIFGYYLHIHDDSEHVVMDTVILHPTTMSYSFTDPELCCGELHICLNVMLNDSYIFYEECQSVFPVHAHMVVGILAGAIFLIPCFFVLIYVVYHDKKHRQKQESKIYMDRKKERRNVQYTETSIIRLLRLCQYRENPDASVQNPGQMPETEKDQKALRQEVDMEELVVIETRNQPNNFGSGVSDISFLMENNRKCLTS